MQRRHFLAGSAAAGLVTIGDVRAWFRETVRQDPRRGPTSPSEYSIAPDVTYLNHASIGTVPRVVQAAHVEYLRVCETNPWLYMWGGAWEEARETTRKNAARLLGCDASEIAINRNTTDGFNVLAAGLPLRAGDEVVFSNLNHDGASVCWEHHCAPRDVAIRHFEIPFDRIAQMSKDEIVERHVAALSDRSRVLVLPHMDNTVGLRTPVREIADRARERGVEWIFADAAQTVGMLPVDVRALGVDALCMSPHKWIQSPKGVGLMFVGSELQKVLRAQTVTWGKKRWKDSSRIFEDYGTRDLPAVLALGDAIHYQLERGIERNANRRHQLWRHLRERVQASPDLLWRSPQTWELGGALCAIEVRGKKSGTLARTLWEKHKIVVRGFQSAKINTLRVAPNTANRPTDLDALLRAVS